MKTKLMVAAVAVFGMVLAGAPAFAREATVHVPFAFTVMGKTMPAGAYNVTEQSPDLLRLQSATSPALQVELPILERLDSHNAPGNARFIFDKDGGKDVLARVWIDRYDGYKVAEPRK
jgi:hypothetical protein